MAETLQQMLGEVLKQVPAPNGGRDWQASLNRNRLIQELLSAKALEAAEEQDADFARRMLRTRKPAVLEHMANEALRAAEAKWPGFRELFSNLMANEMDFMRKAGPQA